MSVAGKVVEWKDLWKVVYYSLGTGVGVTFAFAVAVAGATRFADEMRENRVTRAVVFGAAAALALAVCIAAIVLGIIVMTQKG